MFTPQIEAVIKKVDQLRQTTDDHWQVPAHEARLLAQLVLAGRCESLCEIGHSYGFSTLHLAAAAQQTAGQLHSFDMSEKKHRAAGEHLREAGLDSIATLHLGDAREQVAGFKPDRPYDFVFIDAEKEQSDGYLDAVLPHLGEQFMLVTDNTDTHAEELASFVARLRQLPGVISCNVSVGNGFELTVKR